jgi:DNA-3-methyladenine glycosylase
MDSFDILNNSAEIVAKRLLGCMLERKVDNNIVQVRIVETEAYDQTDAASHSYKGRTARTDIMFGPAGYLYVYFTYGMHYCANIVVGDEGYGAAVLIRAVEPITGEEIMQRSRNKRGIEISNGPAKLCQALGIDKAMNGHDLHNAPLKLIISEPIPTKNITQTTRIGISQAKDVPWRFYITDSPYVSHQ